MQAASVAAIFPMAARIFCRPAVVWTYQRIGKLLDKSSKPDSIVRIQIESKRIEMRPQDISCLGDGLDVVKDFLDGY